MEPIEFETHPDHYRHWHLSFDGPVATLAMDVQEDGGLSSEYRLKLNSYDLSVDIELADAVERIRFEHPEVGAVMVTSLKDRMFCAGANIFMLGSSSHNFKVNFCKYTNETRLGIEDASDVSGIKFIAGVNGVCAGGGYELALACDEIVLVDDGSSAVSLPEVPLLGVLPGTGGLTRVIDKRKVRPDRADFFSTTVEGIRGKRAVKWGLVDRVVPRRLFDEKLLERARELAGQSSRPAGAQGIRLDALRPEQVGDALHYRHLTLAFDRSQRIATLTLRGPEDTQLPSLAQLEAAGADFWALRAFRELSHALVHLRFNEYETGTLLIKTEGSLEGVLAMDTFLANHPSHWLVREITHYIKRTLKRLDYTARSIFALIEPGSCFAGTLMELALAADRIYMLDDPDRPNFVQLSAMNQAAYPMGNGLSRLETRFLGEPARVPLLLAHEGPFDAVEAEEEGLATFSPDDLDWDDELRIAIEERASLSPDALTGMEANLRFGGPETLETKVFGRLSAWQNWIFQRPNAVGDKGALTVYGQAGARPEFDWRRT